MAEKCVALARIGHSATTWCLFLSRRKRRKYWRIMGNSSYVTRVLTRTWCITTWVRSTECVGLCQRLCLVVRVDLMFITAGNETDRAHKIWRGYLHETYFCKQCLSLIGGIKEFEIMVAEFVSAVSSSTHFSVSDRCRWKRCATNITAYSFEYNNNKNTFLSPYNALALKIDLSSTILDAYCYC